MSKHVFPDLETTRRWIRGFTAGLNRPCLVRLEGELGAGKTQFVRWFLEDLGVAGVASPTFAIHHEYESPSGPVDHVDLYRVNSDEDLEATGFWDLFRDEGRLVFVEWADRLPEEVWPRHWDQIRIRLRKGARGEAREMELEIRPRGPASR